MLKYALMPVMACLLVLSAKGQSIELSAEQYDQMKAAGTLPAEFHLNYPTLPPPRVQAASGGERAGGGCNCWIEPDSTYVLAMEPNDDWSSPAIPLPFQFNLYGTLYNACFVNNNGSVSFLLPHSTYSASSFPMPSFRMVAPFWADVDTRGDDGMGLNGGTVKYKLTSNALYVNWTDVGYYNSKTDKHNTFQLIISDGTNTDVGVGSNVSFCYKEMTWTTGSASCLWQEGAGYTCSNAAGIYSCSPSDGLELGFCGTPATVGANRGNAVDFAQFGRFNMPGMAYDGPFGYPDEVGWLSNKHFVFSTAVSSANIAPVASGNSLCDTVRVCVDDPVDISIDFLAPEQGQLATAGYTIIPALNAPVTMVNSGPGNPSNIHLQFTPGSSDQGFYTITYTATDDGTPPLTSTMSVIIEVSEADTPPIFLTASDTIACPGAAVELSASPGYADYAWSNGASGQGIQAGPGTYTVEGRNGGCTALSGTIVVQPGSVPDPVIAGILFHCGSEPSHLSTTEAYDSYLWSTGQTTPEVDVGTGTYTVTVTNDIGCEGTSAAVNVLSAPDPTAHFTGNPAGEVMPGSTVTYTDNSSGNGAPIISWSWDAGNLGQGQGTTLTAMFPNPGSYPVTLTVTTSDGCTHTYTYQQIVIPEEVILPNVFSPNGDDHNDALVFEGAQYYPNTSLKVLNRWGQEVFSSGNYKNTWKPSKDIPDGTYFYILKLNDGKEYTGHVTLLR